MARFAAAYSDTTVEDLAHAPGVISDPENPREVGFFDTAPYKEGPGFGGAWNNYPYFESGTVIVTSMQEGLFVLKKRVRPVS